MDNNLSPIITSLKYICAHCDYNTCNKKDYKKHITTRKHLRIIKCPQISPQQYTCECGKVYQYKSGLCKHKHNCLYKSMDAAQDNTVNVEILTLCKAQIDENKNLSNVILDVIRENKELRELMADQNKQMIDIAKRSGNTTIHNTNNNKFNLNFFLNETCKDAITMSDFINSIKVTMEDFIQTGNIGFVDGISKVMVDRIKVMDLHTRPMHCTDLKRETLYIKNDDKWEKEDSDKTLLRKAVKNIANKNYNQLNVWYNKSKPNVEIIGSEDCENYFKYYKAALGGYDKEEDKKFEEKIIKNVLKEVLLDKS